MTPAAENATPEPLLRAIAQVGTCHAKCPPQNRGGIHPKRHVKTGMAERVPIFSPGTAKLAFWGRTPNMGRHCPWQGRRQARGDTTLGGNTK